MGPEAVCARFQQPWPRSGANRGDGSSCRRLNCQNIHAINRFTHESISLGLGLNIRLRLVACEASAHGIQVVFTQKQDRQFPECG